MPAYTVSEAARYLRLSPRSLWRWTGRRAPAFLSFLDLVDALRLKGRLQFVDLDKCGAPIRLYPFYPGCDSARRVIAIDPRIGFGKPIILRVGITTRTISKRIEAGEADIEVAADYGLTGEEVRQALLFEGAG